MDSVQFSSGQKNLYLPVTKCAQVSSVQVKIKGSYFLDPHKRPKTLKKRPKTPKNAPKRPKTPPKRPQNAPKTPVFWGRFDLKTPVFFSSVQFKVSFFRSGQFRSFQVSSGQVPDLIGRSGQFSSGESHLSSGR
jgi:hypothetical protein